MSSNINPKKIPSKMPSKKVFIGILVYAKRAEVLPLLLGHIKALQYENYELHLMDTTNVSAPELYPYDVLSSTINEIFGPEHKNVFVHEFVPLRVAPTRWEYVSNGRNQLREIFLKTDADFYLSLDDDVLPMPDHLDLLLGDFVIAPQAHAISGVHMTTMRVFDDEHPEGFASMIPVGSVFDSSLPAGCARPITLQMVLEPRLFQVLTCGFGVAIIKREVLERVPIIFNKDKSATSDFAFFLDMNEAGFLLLMDTRVLCPHLKYPLGDFRNKQLDPRNYQLNKKSVD